MAFDLIRNFKAYGLIRDLLHNIQTNIHSKFVLSYVSEAIECWFNDCVVMR